MILEIMISIAAVHPLGLALPTDPCLFRSTESFPWQTFRQKAGRCRGILHLGERKTTDRRN